MAFDELPGGAWIGVGQGIGGVGCHKEKEANWFVWTERYLSQFLLTLYLLPSFLVNHFPPH